jgi:hypothetical protein
VRFGFQKATLIQTLILSLSLFNGVSAKDESFTYELPDELPQFNYNPSDFYVGANGTLNLHASPKNINDSSNFGGSNSNFKNSLNNLGYGGFLGYKHHLPANLALGLEVGYQDDGISDSDNIGSSVSKSSDQDIRVKTKLLTALIVGESFVTPSWGMFLKFGPAYVNQNLNVHSVINGQTRGLVNYSDKIRKFAPYLSMGSEYEFNNNFNIGLSYDCLFGKNGGEQVTGHDAIENLAGKVYQVDQISLNIGYVFPINK